MWPPCRLQLLLLTACAVWQGLEAGPLNSYIVDPKSYLDVIRPANRAASGPDKAPCTDSSAGAASGSCLQGPDAQLHTDWKQSDSLDRYGEALVGSSSSSGSVALQLEQGPSRVLLQVAANPLRLQPPYNVCVSSWAPMVRCNPGDDQSAYKGYQIELFRMAAKEVGWAETDYSFTCMDYSVMMADLNDPAGNCSLSAAGVEVSPGNLAAGLKFSWPTYKSGLRVMISAHLQSGSTWAFSEIFNWEVWVVLGVTGVVVGLLVAFLEWCNCTEPVERPNGASKGKNWQSWEWYSLAKMVHVIPHVGDPNADASRVVVLGYGFVVLVMVSMYTAVAASRITAAALVQPVHSQKDLQGPSSPYKTLTWEQYVPALKAHQKIAADGTPWEREGDLQGMLDKLRSGAYSALVLDAPVLEYVAGTNEDCDLFLVGDVFESFSLALVFPPAFSDATVFDFSRSIVKLQTYQGALDMLENVYIKTGGTAKCFGTTSGGHGSGETIELRQVCGLWYILLMTVGICFIATLAHNVRKDPRKLARIRHFSSFLIAARESETGTAVEPFHGSGDSGLRSTQRDDHVMTHQAPAQPPVQGTRAMPQLAGMPPSPGAAAGLGSSKSFHLDSARDRSAAGSTAPSQEGKAGPGLSGYHSSSGHAGGHVPSQQPMASQTGGRHPSALQVFLGTSSSFVESDEECESPTSPKKKPARHLPGQ